MGASPGWLRETLGVKSPITDSSLGMSLDLVRNYRGASKIRRSTLGAIGISCKNVGLGSLQSQASSTEYGSQRNPKASRSTKEAHDVYVFDQSISGILDLTPESMDGEPPRVFTHPTGFRIVRYVRAYDWLALFASTIKMLETYVLWKLGTQNIWWICALTWAYFFVTAIALQTQHVLRSRIERVQEDRFGTIDVLAGRLPTPTHLGGNRKLFLGLSQTGQGSLSWKITWAVGSIVCAFSLVMTYVALGQEGNNVVYIWVGFQLLWLAGRLLFHHFADIGDQNAIHGLVERPWESLTAQLKQRILELVLGLARYQIHIHPRGTYSYTEDALSSSTFLNLLMYNNYQLQDSVKPDQHVSLGDSIYVSIDAVVGDTVLASSAWVQGSKNTGLDLYDCCLVFLTIQGVRIAIPSVRVLAGQTIVMTDAEKSGNLEVVRKGSRNLGWGLSWWYWIPYGQGRWLQTSSTDLKILGTNETKVVSDAQITHRLKAGDLNISFANVEEVKRTVALSKAAVHLLMNFFPEKV